MTIKITAIIGFYQDRIAGERLLKNLDSYDIHSIWADGRIEGFPKLGDSNLSSDGFREVIQSYKNTTLIDIGLHGPGDLINGMLQTAAEMKYDFTMTFGCDEYLTGDWNITCDALERFKFKRPMRFKVPIIEHNEEGNNNQKHIAERITFMPGYVHVKDIHWLYWSFFNGEDRMLGTERQDPVAFCVTLHHDDTIREKWRNQVIDKFQEEQVPRERRALEYVIN